MDVLTWLLDSDPAIRRQVLADLTRAPADVVAAARERATALRRRSPPRGGAATSGPAGGTPCGRCVCSTGTSRPGR